MFNIYRNQMLKTLAMNKNINNYASCFQKGYNTSSVPKGRKCRGRWHIENDCKLS